MAQYTDGTVTVDAIKVDLSNTKLALDWLDEHGSTEHSVTREGEIVVHSVIGSGTIGDGDYILEVSKGVLVFTAADAFEAEYKEVQ